MNRNRTGEWECGRMGVRENEGMEVLPHTHTPTHPHTHTPPHPHSHTPTHPHRRSAAAWLLLGLVVAVTAWLLTRALLGKQDATWTRIRETGVWRVGMDPSFPPFEDLDPATQRPVGFDVDLAQAIAAHWGVRVELAGVGFDQLIDAVAAHRVDSAISAHPVIPHRAKDVAFSPPYFDAGVLLAVPAGSPLAGPSDPSTGSELALNAVKGQALAGKRIAAEWGSEGDAQARLIQRQTGGRATLALRPSADAALAAVVAGEADAAVVDAVSLALFNRGGAALVAVGEPLRAIPTSSCCR